MMETRRKPYFPRQRTAEGISTFEYTRNTATEFTPTDKLQLPSTGDVCATIVQQALMGLRRPSTGRVERISAIQARLEDDRGPVTVMDVASQQYVQWGQSTTSFTSWRESL